MLGTTASAPGAAGGGPPALHRVPAYHWYVLALLTFTYACHSIDRIVLSVVLEPLKLEFHLTDTQLGALGGPAYAIAFVVGSIPLGLAVDRVPRRILLPLAVALWSGLTVATASARNFTGLFLARMGVGLAESPASPASMSLIGDYFPPERRATAVGMFYLATTLGAAISFGLGGWIAAHLGWRSAFMLAGAPGLLAALLLFTTLREPIRGRYDPPATTVGTGSWREVAQYIWRDRAILNIIVALCVATFVLASVWAWGMSFLIRVHKLPLGEAGMVMAITTGVFGSIGSASAGFLADRIAKGVVWKVTIVPAAYMLLTLPLGVAMAHATSTPAAIAFMFATGMFVSGWLGPLYGTIISLTPAPMRGRLSSISQCATTLFGMSIGPLLTGVLSDYYGSGANSLRPALTIVLLFELWAVFHCVAAMRNLRNRSRT